MYRLAIRVRTLALYLILSSGIHKPNRTDEMVTFFSILELLTLITTLLENFEFSIPSQDEKTRIYRKPSAIMSPMTENQPGAWMGLAVKALK